MEPIWGQNRHKIYPKSDFERTFNLWKKQGKEKVSSRRPKVMFYYSKTQFFINPPGCQFGIEFGSKWSPETTLKSKETGFGCSLKFISISTRFIESKRTPNRYPKKLYLGDFSVLWTQVYPKAPQRVHSGSKINVLGSPWGMFPWFFLRF